MLLDVSRITSISVTDFIMVWYIGAISSVTGSANKPWKSRLYNDSHNPPCKNKYSNNVTNQQNEITIKLLQH